MSCNQRLSSLKWLGSKDLDPRWIKGKIRSGGFLRILTVGFLLFLAPAGGSNPAGAYQNLFPNYTWSSFPAGPYLNHYSNPIGTRHI